ncbi:MAG: hypothetical protein CM15mP46_7480 [Alphaproteobacteria bacterium]|nr:MAG: hypothetical protein CM15mP46_7480 [Alphaproteobacteria bacterium]
MNAVMDHAARGGAVLGYVTGFRCLPKPACCPALIRNAGLRFSCRMVRLKLGNHVIALYPGLTAGQSLDIPVAHNEGNYFADDDTLDRLQIMARLHFAILLAMPKGQPTRMARRVILPAFYQIMGA